MKKTLIITGLAIFSLLIFTGFKGKGDCRGWHKGGGEKILMRIANVLDLNEEQEDKLVGVKNAMQEMKKAHWEQRQNFHQTILEQVKAERLDTDEMLALYDKKTAEIRDQLPLVLEELTEFHASLTPEQKAEATKWMEKKAERMQNRQRRMEKF